MEILQFNAPMHYESLCSWWKAHDWSVIDLDLLPATGFIVPNVCAGFLYATDSGFCLSEFIISNPAIEYKIRSEGLDMLINKLAEEAKKKGYKVMFTSVEHEGLIKRYENNGFIKTDTNMTNLLKVL